MEQNCGHERNRWRDTTKRVIKTSCCEGRNIVEHVFWVPRRAGATSCRSASGSAGNMPDGGVRLVAGC